MIKKIMPTFILLGLIISSCNLPMGAKEGEYVSSEAAVQTKAALTVEAMSTLFTKQAPNTTLATQTPFPTLPPTVTAAATVIYPTQTSQVIPCDRAKFISETIPDNTVFAAGTTFTKTWTLQNTGSCTWNTNYRLIFNGGTDGNDAMGAPAAGTPLSASVPSGGTISVSVELTAPAEIRTHKGYFMLQNASGARFAIGDYADKPFWVQIVVGNTPTSSVFAVTSTSLTASPSSYSGVCPVTITFNGSITSNRAGVVQYHFIRSDGTTGSVQTLTFSDPGTQSVSTTWTLGSAGSTYSGWEQIYIDSPNHQSMSQGAFNITCNP